MNIDNKINKIAGLITPESLSAYFSCSPSMAIIIAEFMRSMGDVPKGVLNSVTTVALASFCLGWSKGRDEFEDDSPEEVLEQIINTLAESTDPQALRLMEVFKSVKIEKPIVDKELSDLLEGIEFDL